MKPTKCYAVTGGEYSDYHVIAIYRQRDDANRVVNKMKRQWKRARVEEFDYYEGEPLPAPLEET
jgi:hypothetical protein